MQFLTEQFWTKILIIISTHVEHFIKKTPPALKSSLYGKHSKLDQCFSFYFELEL
jgi:hypothetical protein